MPYACPDCGAPVSERAAVCPQCGFPIRRDAMSVRPGPGAPPPGGRNTRVLIIALVAGGLLMLAIVGVLAAIAIPRLAQVAKRAKEMEGESTLRQIYLREQSYREEHGVYTSRLADLDWEVPRALYYDFEVSAAGDRDLCLEAVPKPAAGVRPLSMDAEGRLHRAPGCSGDAEDYRTGETSSAPGLGGSAGARELLRQVYAGVVAYRAEHGRDPADLGDVLGHVRDTRAAVEFSVVKRT
ncbi:MAG TPA: zinc-ribbon domain-containing protein, partial [Longimicrobiaceae bacterium]